MHCSPSPLRPFVPSSPDYSPTYFIVPLLPTHPPTHARAPSCTAHPRASSSKVPSVAPSPGPANVFAWCLVSCAPCSEVQIYCSRHTQGLSLAKSDLELLAPWVLDLLDATLQHASSILPAALKLFSCFQVLGRTRHGACPT